MWIEEHDSNEIDDLDLAWENLQRTPSCVERFHAHLGLPEVEAHYNTWVFCLCCGFWVEDTHQCPQEVRA